MKRAARSLHTSVMPIGGTSFPLRIAQSTPESSMDKNRTEGTKHEVKGAVKEAVGKVTGDHVKQAAGNVEKNAGKVQKEAGKMADKSRDVNRNH